MVKAKRKISNRFRSSRYRKVCRRIPGYLKSMGCGTLTVTRIALGGTAAETFEDGMPAL